jgi:hypothetical protein
MIHFIGNALIILSAIPAVLSVLVYARVNWRRAPMGPHLMAYMTVFATVLTLSTIRQFTGDSWWFQLLRLIVFVGVPVVLWWRLVLLVKAQRESRS